MKKDIEMKLDFFETHDRLLEFKKQIENIYHGCMDCLRNVPDSIHPPFYIYAHSRKIEMDEKISIILDPTIPNELKNADERLIWVPCVTKPRASPNSYLYLVLQRPDLVKICWMLPKQEYWHMFDKGKMTHDNEIWQSIQHYKYARNKLNEPDKEGPNEKQILAFRKTYGEEAHRKKLQKKEQEMIEKLYSKPLHEEESQSSSDSI